MDEDPPKKKRENWDDLEKAGRFEPTTRTDSSKEKSNRKFWMCGENCVAYPESDQW